MAHNKIKIQAFGIIILAIGIGLQTIYAQEEYLCPNVYDSEKRTIPLADQQISRSPTISKAVCTYHEQSTSKTIFNVSWSPTGKIYGDNWCNEKLTIENGIGTYQSKTHYVEISASGIQPFENNYAQDFMQTLFDIAKDDAMLCNGQIEQSLPRIEKQMEKLDDIDIPTSNENTTATIENSPTAIPAKNDVQFPLEILIVAIVAGIGFFIYKKYKS